jgi:hypothetical protein
MWAAKAGKLGYRWNMGNGQRIRFWEDLWVGSCSLAIQYWGLYSSVNEHGKSISEIWDGEVLRLSFRRTVDRALMTQ